MTLIYIWIGIVAILGLMLIGRFIARIVLSCKGISADWSSFNDTMLVLAFIAFLPIAIKTALVKKEKLS